jgi:hypothetical protein
MLRKIFCLRGGSEGNWRKWHNEELHNFCSSSGIIRMFKSNRMGWVGHVACMTEKGNAYRVLVGKSEGRRPLGRLRGIWNLKEI